MRVHLLPGDQGACGHYRLAWPGQAVSNEGEHVVSLSEPGAVQMRMTRGLRGPGRFEVRGLPDDAVDVAVVQRIGSENGVRLIQHLQEQGVAVVLDADDALWAIDPDNASHRQWNGRPWHWKWMDEAARLADLVTVTTPALAARYGREHGRVEVIPNYLPTGALATDAELESRVGRRTATRVGWAGTLKSHPHDLPVAHPAVHAARGLGAEVHVLGDGIGVHTAWGLPYEQVIRHPAVPLDRYHAALDALDVGLVPLTDDAFNRSKSWLKALEYAGRGIPSIVSPTPANRALSEWLLGVRVVETPYLWPAAVQDLLEAMTAEPGSALAMAWALRGEVLRSVTNEGQTGARAAGGQRAADRRRNLTGARA